MAVSVRPKRVVIAEEFSGSGLSVLRQDGIEAVFCIGKTREALADALKDADGLIVRSQTRVDRDLIAAGPKLHVVARAGVGVDSIDVSACTQAGIVVVNTPDANVIAAVEQTFALMLGLLRHTPQAYASMKAGKWERQTLVGGELYGKALGIAGLGRIGGAVAARARAFGMQVLVYDPYISSVQAEAHDVQLLSLDDLLERSDIVTLHMPLNDRTESLIDASRLKKMKPNALLINCARGGLIDEDALLAALDGAQLAGAALDVFAKEPPERGSSSARLQAHSLVLATPHLGGSTREALERVAVELARDIVNVLAGRPAEGAVNAPIPRGVDAHKVRPYLELAYRIGVLYPQLHDRAELSRISMILRGEIAEVDAAPLVTGFLSGLLQGTADRRISVVNADALARERGLSVEVHAKASDEWVSSLEIGSSSQRVVGTALHHGLRIVQIDDFEIDANPAGSLILTRHRDIPGMIGRVGSVLGDAGINISNMQVARAASGRDAMMVLSVDRAPESATVDALRKVGGMLSVRSVQI